MRKKLGLPEGWIVTASGEQFSPLHPEPDKISVADIAHALGNQCRFTGHCRHFYSVAQHSVLCASIARNLFDDEDMKTLIRRTLLHDASEAYLCDIARPVKHTWEMRHYREIEKRLQEVIDTKFGLSPCVEQNAVVKEIDEKIVTNEALALMPVIPDGWQLRPGYTAEELETALPSDWLPQPFAYWDPRKATDEFLKFYGRYC